MGDYDDPELTGQDRRRRPLLPIAAAVLALVVGLAVGYVVGGGTSRESSVAVVETAPPSVPPTADAAPDPDTPQPCLTAGAAGAQVLEELNAAVQAIGALDPTALREILDRLQPLQRELESAVAGCGSQVAPTTPPG